MAGELLQAVEEMGTLEGHVKVAVSNKWIAERLARSSRAAKGSVTRKSALEALNTSYMPGVGPTDRNQSARSMISLVRESRTNPAMRNVVAITSSKPRLRT